MDPRSAPATVLRGHAPNELSKLQIDAWPSRPPPRATPPASTEPFTMPTGDRGRLDQHESLPPPGPEPSQMPMSAFATVCQLPEYADPASSHALAGGPRDDHVGIFTVTQ